MEQDEKDRLAQLGKDRRLAEAVDALDLAASEFVRTAGDENAEEETIRQAGSNYRAAVERRNRCFDEAAGIQPGEAGAAPTIAIDESRIAELIEAEVSKRLAEAGEEVEGDGQPEEPAKPQGGGKQSGGSKGGSGGGSS